MNSAQKQRKTRVGKTRDLFKKTGDIKGTFHGRMDTTKDRNSKDPTEAEEIKRWHECTNELHKKVLMTQITMMVLQIEGKKWKQWHFIFVGSKITVENNCSHEIKRHLLLGRKAMKNLDNILNAETSLCWQRTIQAKQGVRGREE